MRVALITTFAADRKAPLAELLERIHQAFLDAGLGEPTIRFTFADAPLAGSVSSVDRVLKRFAEMERFLTSESPLPGGPAIRRLANSRPPGPPEAVEFATLLAVAAGVPRSFPFHGVSIHLHSPEFGDAVPIGPASAGVVPGVLLTDSWWVNGRNRSLSACVVVEASPDDRKLPPPAGPVAAVLAACGKAGRTAQVPLADAPAAGTPARVGLAGADAEIARAVGEVVASYRTRLGEVVARAGLPHDLPPTAEALRDTALGVSSGPRRPALERAFRPMGYDCRGESGTFTLQRRTTGNHTAELYLDVGTWSHGVTAVFRVLGVGFRAALPIPVTARALGATQYPIGDAERWQKIVENLAALVAELDRSFVPDVEAASGPSPEWYQPDS
jgi:hypothetical protein